MNLRTPRRLTVLALVAPALAVLPSAGPAAATRPDTVPAAYVVDEWTRNPSPALPDVPYSRVEVTYDASYGITMDGSVESAVDNHLGNTLVAPDFDRPIVDVTGGTSFGMALDDLGHLRTWGNPPAISTEDQSATYRDVAAHEAGAIGVTTDGELRFWGTSFSFDPGFPADADIVSIDMDYSAAVAVTADGQVLSSGSPLLGGYAESKPFPADRADETFTAVDAGFEFALALTDDGQVVSWGSYKHGQDPVPDLPEGRHAVAISAGMRMAAVVLDDGSILRWGLGEYTVIPAQRTGLPAVDIDLDRYRSAVIYAILASTTAPVITGTPQFGTELTATAGEWSDEPDEVHYEWRVHTRGTSRAVGTDTSTYTPTAQDALDWGTVTVTVTADRDGFLSGTATSAATDHVAQRMFTTAPSVTVQGQPRVGQVLTANTTAATPAPDTSDLTWFRAPEEGSDEEFAERIPGASGATLTLTPALLGARVFVNVTSYKEGYEPAFDETEPITVRPGVLTGPTVTVSGIPRVGQVLTATTTAATPAPDSSVLTWFQAPAGGSPQQIEAASGTTLTLTPALVGARIFAKVTSRKEGYETASVQSEPITVLPGVLTAPTVTVSGRSRVGQVLTATTTAASATYQWLRGSSPIPGATTSTYRPVAADLGSTLRVRLTATAAGYDSASVDSAPTAAVTLAAAKLKVTVPRKAVVGRKATTKIRGLAAGERFSVKIAGKHLTGTATKSGVGTVKLPVTGKPGTRAVTVVGSLPDRKGTATLRVVPPRRR